jgi:5-methylcytosine-specific restriction endonuclease McrA
VKPIPKVGTQEFRLPEHGRIRMGAKVNGKRPTSLDRFRFTSVDREAVEQIAAVYGGDVQRWDEPTANQRNQWQVTITTSEVRVWLPPGALSIGYELWSGGGIQRRCDGEDCTVVKASPAGLEEVSVPCICWKNQRMECKPKTRLNVILPDVRFGGTWRLETGAWAAFHEMPGMEQMLQELQSQGLVQAKLGIVEMKKVVPKSGGGAETRRWKVPQLRMDQSPQEIVAGAASVAALTVAQVEQVRQVALPVATAELIDDELTGTHVVYDDDVIDAELVEDELEGWDDPAEIPVEVKAAGVVRNRGKGPKWVRKDP